MTSSVPSHNSQMNPGDGEGEAEDDREALTCYNKAHLKISRLKAFVLIYKQVLALACVLLLFFLSILVIVIVSTTSSGCEEEEGVKPPLNFASGSTTIAPSNRTSIYPSLENLKSKYIFPIRHCAGNDKCGGSNQVAVALVISTFAHLLNECPCFISHRRDILHNKSIINSIKWKAKILLRFSCIQGIDEALAIDKN